jgi:hypothetical protein
MSGLLAEDAAAAEHIAALLEADDVESIIDYVWPESAA